MTSQINKIKTRGSHNSYTRDEGLLDQLSFHHVRAIELDIHNGHSNTDDADGDWYVYHTDAEYGLSTMKHLSEYINILTKWHNDNPDHEVVFIFFDQEDSLPSGTGRQTKAKLDILISSLPNLYKPSDLKKTGCTLQQSVTGSNSWPTVAALRGKFICIFSQTNIYAGDQSTAESSPGFVMKAVTSSSQNLNADNWILFFNCDGTNTSASTFTYNVYTAGFMSRAYGCNDETKFANVGATTGSTGRCNFITNDKINSLYDTWSITHNKYGYPFQFYDGTVSSTTAGDQNTSNIMTMRFRCNDLNEGSSSDHAVFAYTAETGSTWTNTWITRVNSATTHCETWSKMGLMLRSTVSTDGVGRYFAVMREQGNNPSLDHDPRIQWRSGTGIGSKSDWSNNPDDGMGRMSASAHCFLKIVASYNGTSTLCTGYISYNGSTWKTVDATKTIDANLNYQGIFASSHGTGNYAVDTNSGSGDMYCQFNNTTFNGIIQHVSNLTKVHLGTVSASNLFNGIDTSQ